MHPLQGDHLLVLEISRGDPRRERARRGWTWAPDVGAGGPGRRCRPRRRHERKAPDASGSGWRIGAVGGMVSGAHRVRLGGRGADFTASGGPTGDGRVRGPGFPGPLDPPRPLLRVHTSPPQDRTASSVPAAALRRHTTPRARAPGRAAGAAPPPRAPRGGGPRSAAGRRPAGARGRGEPPPDRPTRVYNPVRHRCGPAPAKGALGPAPPPPPPPNCCCWSRLVALAAWLPRFPVPGPQPR